MKKIIIVVTLLGGLSACSSHPTEAEIAAPSSVKPKPPAASIEAQQVAAEQKADFVGEIIFAKQQNSLTAGGKEIIQNMLKEAAAKGKVQEIKVITWADSEYPSIDTKKLSKVQQNLAKSRNVEIEEYLKSLNSEVKVKTYSMAERANALQDFVGSSEARIKKSLEIAGIPTSGSNVKFPSKSSKAILLILME